MDVKRIRGKFESIGASVVVEHAATGWRDYTLNVEDRNGRETFFLRYRPAAGIEMEVLDVQRLDRHLVLMVRENGGKSKFLCGHDERHWFVASIPEAAPASTVVTAKEALKPEEVRSCERGLRPRDRGRRKNPASIRQGEWFFVPAADIERKIKPEIILRNEPLLRSVNGRVGKPHTMQEAVRFGGEVVYVRGGMILSAKKYEELRGEERKTYTPRTRNPEVYCRGTVRHPDHKTIYLRGWHRVYMNTESGPRAAEQVDFLD